MSSNFSELKYRSVGVMSALRRMFVSLLGRLTGWLTNSWKHHAKYQKLYLIVKPQLPKNKHRKSMYIMNWIGLKSYIEMALHFTSLKGFWVATKQNTKMENWSLNRQSKQWENHIKTEASNLCELKPDTIILVWIQRMTSYLRASPAMAPQSA